MLDRRIGNGPAWDRAQRLFKASVAPLVKITRPPLGNRLSTCSRASSTAAAAARPARCIECGLAKPIDSGPDSQGSMACSASGASGVVA
ncbi:MAG: hypothetical protein O9272_09550 [Brevundimonas sp.]|nr:hypothetical protein [Brevundimonas sp.]